jgi:ferrochelatase
MPALQKRLGRLAALAGDFDFTAERWAVLLLNMGAPRYSSEIRKYLVNVFSDRDIISLPLSFLLQKPLAHLIARFRASKVRRRYELIGGSPLPQISDQLADYLQQHLRSGFAGVQVYPAMRYAQPSIDQQLAKAQRDDCRFVLAVPLYPQYCHATTGSAFLEIERQHDRLQQNPPLAAISDFHDNQRYIDLLRTRIDASLTAVDDDQKTALVFAAHSIPAKLRDSGDPYVAQIEKTSQLAAGERPYHIAYQSRTGPVEWVGPDFSEVIDQLVAENFKKLVVVPVSFTIDNLETNYDLDIFWKEAAAQRGLSLQRVGCLNASPDFVQFLSELISERIDEVRLSAR